MNIMTISSNNKLCTQPCFQAKVEPFIEEVLKDLAMEQMGEIETLEKKIKEIKKWGNPDSEIGINNILQGKTPYISYPYFALYNNISTNNCAPIKQETKSVSPLHSFLALQEKEILEAEKNLKTMD